MIVSEDIYRELCLSAGEIKLENAKIIAQEGRVRIKKVMYGDTKNFSVRAIVSENKEVYGTHIEIKNGEIENVECECQDYEENYGTCKHIAATMIAFSKNEEYINLFDKEKSENIEKKEENKRAKFVENNKSTSNTNKESYRIFNQMIRKFYQDDNSAKLEEKNEKNIRIIPILKYSAYRGILEVEFKIGKGQMYKLRNLASFYRKIRDREYYRYGTKLEFTHCKQAFDEESLEVLNFLLKYAEIFDYLENTSGYYEFTANNSIKLEKTRIDEFFDICKGKEIECTNEDRKMDYNSLVFLDENPDIKFEITKENDFEYKISPSIKNIYNYRIIEGEKYIYFLDGYGKIFRCTEEFEKTNLKLLKIFRENFSKDVVFQKNDLPNFLSVVFPKIKKDINIQNIKKDEIEKFIPQDLSVKMYLDYDIKNRIIAKVIFCYGDEEYNPFSSKKVNIVKNIAQENDVLNMLMNTGFMRDTENEGIILANEDEIYNFLSNEIDEYMRKFEVLATDAFKEKEIREPQISSIGVRVENNLLKIDFSKLNFEREELVAIMQKFQLKKKFHRLKNGKFIQLNQNSSIEFLQNFATGLDIDFKQLENGEVSLPIYRSMYLEKILENMENTQISKDEKFRNIIQKVEDKDSDINFDLPKSINAELRNYQKIGYKWIRTLDNFSLGGILADDMGLGKTLQLITVIAAYLEKNENPKPTMVVCPSSLTLNWKNEIEKFSSNIKTIVINGSSNERKEKIQNISDYNVIISSYDSLKRDIEIYEKNNCEFKYILADEAQYIKNANTQNSKAIKKLVSETRYALTGTPIENSLSELWSIFDFIMPGYLFSYKKFRNLYELPIVKEEDSQAMNKLRMLIEPFILRRIKKEVLTELPDKTITILNNEMEEEQSKIYAAYMQNAKNEAIEEINTNGLEKSQIKILALLMRLRQICCHPSLFIENYEGESSKLNQCIEIIKDAVEGNHKILLFSGYTSMFGIIEKKLKEENIKFFKLTGQTKVAERIKLVDEFNSNEEIKVFLISLKAGGTGLNLTGADMVIHYDPWWNLSAENQATDRTYRIGQKKNVQVYKLITKNTIEEKIYDLQKQKEKLVDNMLSTGGTFINKLSKEDIMELFS